MATAATTISESSSELVCRAVEPDLLRGAKHREQDGVDPEVDLREPDRGADDEGPTQESSPAAEVRLGVSGTSRATIARWSRNVTATPTTLAMTTLLNPRSAAKTASVAASVTSRPETFATTTQWSLSCAWRTGCSAEVMSVRKAPAAPIRIAVFVCSLNGSSRPTASPARTASAETPCGERRRCA